MSEAHDGKRTYGKRSGRTRWFRRGPWENGAAAVIGLGIVMLVQPLSLALYSHSFTLILAGTLGFMVVSHFPE